MNKKISIIFPIVTLLLCGHARVSFAQETGPLTIHISNFQSSEGLAVVNIFRERDEIPKKPFMSLKAPVENGKAEILVGELPNGNYAVIAYHDENSNGMLDHKLGFPNEPLGFSNAWELGLFSGMPTFRKLKFAHKSETAIKIIVD
jgi:uncharacterized protein (DUF2141 family)